MWISYNTGDTVPELYTKVEFVFRDGDSAIDYAGNLDWQVIGDEDDIVAYRAIES